MASRSKGLPPAVSHQGTETAVLQPQGAEAHQQPARAQKQILPWHLQGGDSPAGSRIPAIPSRAPFGSRCIWSWQMATEAPLRGAWAGGSPLCLSPGSALSE